MSTTAPDTERIIALLTQQVESLEARIQALEKRASGDRLTPETVELIAAAVAAFMGKRARVKFIRRLGSSEADAWTTQGRVAVAGRHEISRSNAW
ncbi:MAG: hypothetical protein JNM04_04880 [Chthonomonas sp.]|nr:hypothetical protein [Chthonomonas sp.]